MPMASASSPRSTIRWATRSRRSTAGASWPVFGPRTPRRARVSCPSRVAPRPSRSWPFSSAPARAIRGPKWRGAGSSSSITGPPAADALVAGKRVPEAIPRQRALLGREPGAPEPALSLAQLYEWTGREPDAIGVYEGLDRAGILPEGSALRLAQLYRFQNRPADFVRLAERLLSRRPDDASLRREAIETATGLGRADLALRLLRPLVDRQPADETLALRYLGLAAEARRLDDGPGVWRGFLRATPRAKIHP